MAFFFFCLEREKKQSEHKKIRPMMEMVGGKVKRQGVSMTEETSLSEWGPGELIIDRMIKADEKGFRPAVRDLIVGLLPPGVLGARRRQWRQLRIDTLYLG